jgi:peptide/nickel transport system permease protein
MIATLRAFADSDLFWSFRRNRLVVLAAWMTLLFILIALMAPFISPQDPYDLAKLDLTESFLPPPPFEGGVWHRPLGTDDQGRDLLSAIFYGSRVSLLVGVAAVFVALVLGVLLGLLSGYLGGTVDAVIMRVADVQLAFPAILIAMLIDGMARGLLGRERHEDLALFVIIGSIGLSLWVQFARTVRASTMVEKNKEYVLAARVIGRRRFPIMVRHVLPNVMGPVLVIATINFAIAIMTEATLSFLGVGVPATQPSLGTLIRIGNDFLFSGEWWIAAFPGLTLAILVLSVNLLGDWLRDAFNPRLRGRS